MNEWDEAMQVSPHEPVIHDCEQGSDEWHALRCGLLTASQMHLLLTPSKLQIAKNDKVRAHMYEIMAQRITGYVEPHFISADMERGHENEPRARALYAETRDVEVQQVGFVTRQIGGITIGCSPDGLIGADGMIECKSRRGRIQVESIANGGLVPIESRLQIQTNLLVTGRAWCDYLGYSGGLPMQITRVPADEEMQGLLVRAAMELETLMGRMMAAYEATVAEQGWPMTERVEEGEIAVTGGDTDGVVL